MVYYIDLIFIAERLFVLDEMLKLKLNERMIQEYKKLALFFVRHLETSTILPSTLMRSKVREIVTIFRSKSMADHCRPIRCV